MVLTLTKSTEIKTNFVMFVINIQKISNALKTPKFMAFFVHAIFW